MEPRLCHAGACDGDAECTQTIAEAPGLTLANGDGQKAADAKEDTLHTCSLRDSLSIWAFSSVKSLFSKNHFPAKDAEAHPPERTKRDPDRGQVASWMDASVHHLRNGSG